MDPYLRQLAAIPPLDAREEHELAARAWRGDLAARDQLITASLRLVTMRAHLLGFRGARLMDAVQAGTVGLIEAVDRFDPHRGCRLSTYAWWWIGQAMKQAQAPGESGLGQEPPAPSGAAIEVGENLLAGLDPDLALVLEARFGKGSGQGRPMPRREVARRLGLTISQVRTKEAKALSQLRRRLAKVGHRAPREQRGADPP